jgi:hypothetical protein
MRVSVFVLACAACGSAPRAPAEPQAAQRSFAVLMQPTVAADLELHGRAGDTQIVIACDLAAPELAVARDGGVEQRGTIGARDCRALWAAALLVSAGGGCSDEDLASACIRAVDHGRVARACCEPGADPLFDAALRDFTIAAARTPTRAAGAAP